MHAGLRTGDTVYIEKNTVVSMRYMLRIFVVIKEEFHVVLPNRGSLSVCLLCQRSLH